MVKITENIKLLNTKYYFFVFNLIILFLCKEMIIGNKFLILIILANFILMMKNKINDLEFLMWSVILPSEIYLVFSICIFSIKNLFDNRKNLRVYTNELFRQKYLLYFVVFILLNNLISAIMNKNYLSPIMSLIYLFCMLYIYICLKIKKVKFEQFLKYFDFVMISQFIILIAQAIYYWRFYPSDIFSGSFINAHMLGVWIGWYIVIKIIYVFRYKDIKNIIQLLLGLIFMYITDSKHIIVALGLGVIIFMIMNLIKIIKNKILAAGLFLILGIYLCTNLVNSNIFKQYINKDAYVYKYMYEEPYNNKFNYFDKTVNENLKNTKFIFGFGSGVYGSRIANLRAHEYMAKDSNLAIAFSKFIPGYILEDYKQFAEKYDEKYLKSVSDMSAVLSYPFSSIISILAEMGILGYILLLLLWGEKEKEEKYIYGIICTSMLCLMIFDSYFEMTQVAILFWLLMGVTYEKDTISN